MTTIANMLLEFLMKILRDRRRLPRSGAILTRFRPTADGSSSVSVARRSSPSSSTPCPRRSTRTWSCRRGHSSPWGGGAGGGELGRRRYGTRRVRLRDPADAEGVVPVTVPVADVDLVGGPAVGEHEVGGAARDGVLDVVRVAAPDGEGVAALVVPVAREDRVACAAVGEDEVGGAAR
ncbi:hypothetical protein [Georgenia sp. SUBG003]|uniref:hypothetical protein n=1 Tax=Georgenia sp. SUBG003 TaxID=1497974 RepID=UPI003AB5286B